MAKSVRKTAIKSVPLAEVKDDLSRYLKEAANREIIIAPAMARKPACSLGFGLRISGWSTETLAADSRFWSASPKPGPACARVAEFALKTLSHK